MKQRTITRSTKNTARGAVRAVAMLLPAALLLCSCMKDPEPDDGLIDEGREVTIAFNPVSEGVASVTRGNGYHGDPNDPELRDPTYGGPNNHPDLAAGRTEDINITYLRVLLYKHSTGELKKNFATVVNQPGGLPVLARVLTGIYDVVFIINEKSDAQSGGYLTDFLADESNYNLLNKLENALIHNSAFDSASNPVKDIPMYEVVRNVYFKGKDDLEVGGVAQAIPWDPMITRAGVRLSLDIILRPDQYASWSPRQVKIDGLTPSSRLIPNQLNPWPGNDNLLQSRSIAAATTAGSPGIIEFLNAGLVVNSGDPYDQVRVRYDRIILPEHKFSPRGDSDKALVLSMPINGKDMDGRISVVNPDSAIEGYTLPRNTWLHLDVTVASTKLNVHPQVVNWNTRDTLINPGYNNRITAASPIYLPGSDHVEEFAVSTDYTGGIDLRHNNGAVIIEYEQGGPTGWIQAVTIEGSPGDMERVVRATALPNTTGTTRTAWFYVVAGDASKKIELIQSVQGVLASPGMIGYVASGPNFGQLTLRGSREWDNTPIEAAAEKMFPGEGLHPETVYVAYFKWGSLVALGGGPVQDRFDATDVVRAPWEYEYQNLNDGKTYYGAQAIKTILGNKSGQTAWADIPWRKNKTNWEPGAPHHAIGDPCVYYFGEGGTGWRLPLGGSENGGWNGGTFGNFSLMTNYSQANATAVNYALMDTFDLDSDIPYNTMGTLAGLSASPDADWSMFLPSAGYRNPGAGELLAVFQPSDQGYYWSGTTLDSTNGNMLITSVSGSMLMSVWPFEYKSALPIRCVTDVTPVRKNVVMAAPGVPGIKKSDYDALMSGKKTLGDGTYTLTLHGSGTYRDEPRVKAIADAQFGGLEREPVYTVYFKWGSQIGMVAPVDPSGDWSPEDVVWIPEGLDMQQVDLNNFSGFSNSAAPVTIGNGYDIVNNPALGHGDPCSTIPGMWRIPSATTNSWNGMRSNDWEQRSRDIDIGAVDDYAQPNENGLSLFSVDGTMFLPGAGFYSYSGRYSNAASLYMSGSVGSNSYYSHTLWIDHNSVVITRGLEITSAFAVRCVLAPQGVPVPRGVIGYYADGPRKGQLTLEGDKSYYDKGQADQWSHNVWAAYFKWGSAIATDGSDEGDGFTPDDLVAVPHTYGSGNVITLRGMERLKADIGTRTGAAAWAIIPARTDITAGQNFATPLASVGSGYVPEEQGWYDPCSYWFDERYTGAGATYGGYLGGGWRTPTGPENAYFVGHPLGWNDGEYYSYTNGAPNGSFLTGAVPGGLNDQAYFRWTPPGANPMANPGIGTFPASLAGPNQNLPAAGYRAAANGNSWETPGSLTGQGVAGNYWASTALSSSSGYYLSFNHSGDQHVYPVAGALSDFAVVVRCVQNEPPLPQGVHAAPGVIGYFADGPDKGKLTLKGSNVYAENPAFSSADLSQYPVFAAYFKWGSLVAMSSDISDVDTARGPLWFDADDVIEAPRQYNGSHGGGLAGVKSMVTAANITLNGYDAIPYKYEDEDWNGPESEYSAGLGNPCSFYFGNGADDNPDPYYKRLADYNIAGDWDRNNRNPFHGLEVTTGGEGGGWWLYYTHSNYSVHRSMWVDRNQYQGLGYLPTNGAVGGDGNQYYLNNEFWPAAGYRAKNDGKVTGVDSIGYYWSDRSTIVNGNSLYFNYNTLEASAFSSNTSGFVVRCYVQPAM